MEEWFYWTNLPLPYFHLIEGGMNFHLKVLSGNFKFVHKKKTFRTVLRQGCAEFCRNLRNCCGWTVQIWEFAICGLVHLSNFRICDFWISPRTCGFSICGLFFEKELDDAHDIGGGEVLLLHLLQVPHLPGRQRLLQGDETETINQSPNL